MLGAQIQCDTVTDNPQTYNGNQGEGRWLVKTKTPKGSKLHGPFVVSSDTKDATRGATVLALALQHAGIARTHEADRDRPVPVRHCQVHRTPSAGEVQSSCANSLSQGRSSGPRSSRSEASCTMALM